MTATVPDVLTLIYHCDPGHGWLQITRPLAKQILGDKFTRITGFSYQHGHDIYLEEDQDAGLLIQALKASNRLYTIREIHYEYLPIRSYESFRPY